MRNRKLAAAVLIAAGLLATSAPAQDKRQLGAHEHGSSTLNIAIQGNKVELELDAPGEDIVGFETEAKTPEQKAAVTTAIKSLSQPTALFVFPPAAGCSTAEAKVEVNANAQGHSEFEGKYTLTCKAPDEITGIGLGSFFKAFPKSQKMTVTVITATGQTKFDATPAQVNMKLAGGS